MLEEGEWKDWLRPLNSIKNGGGLQLWQRGCTSAEAHYRLPLEGLLAHLVTYKAGELKLAIWQQWGKRAWAWHLSCLCQHSAPARHVHHVAHAVRVVHQVVHGVFHASGIPYHSGQWRPLAIWRCMFLHCYGGTQLGDIKTSVTGLPVNPPKFFC